MTILLLQEKGFKKKAAYMGIWVDIFCEGLVETNRHSVNLEEFSMNKFQGEPTSSPQYSWALLPFSYLISLLLSFTGGIISNEKPNFDSLVILLGLTDIPELQSIIFILLLLIYIISILGSLMIIILTLLDSHLQTHMHFFLWNFFLEIFFISTFTPRLLLSISTGNKTISFVGCFTQYFFVIFFVAIVLPSGCHVLWPLCGHMQTLTLHDHHEQQNLHSASLLLLAGWISHHPIPSHHDQSTGFLCLQYPESLFLWLWTLHRNFLLRHKTPWACWLHFSGCDIGGHPGAGDSLLHKHHLDHSKDPFCSAKEESLFHMFFPHDCHHPLLWQLHRHVHKTFSKRWSCLQ